MSDEYTTVPDFLPASPTPDLSLLGGVITASGAELPPDLYTAAGEVVERLIFTDMDRGRLFTMFNVSGIAWDPSINRFRLWSGNAWEEDPSTDHLGAHQRIEQTVDLWWQLACERTAVQDDDDATTAKRKRAIRNAAHSLRSRTKRATILQDAKHHTARPEAEYDRNPEEVNTPAGLLDLRTGELTRHHPGMLVTRVTAVPYDPSARSQSFQELIYRTMPDAEIRTFVQEAFGASLTGLTALRMVFVLHGPTGTGKTTLVRLLHRAMGTYASTLPESAIRQATSAGAINEGLAHVVGRRAAFADELPEGFQPNLALLKRLTGSETVHVEQKYKPDRAVRTTAKLWLATNHPLVVAVDDDAAWCRIYAVPFESAIPEDRQDKTYADRLAADPAVLAAALAWGVEGARRVLAREGRLEAPEAVQQRRRELRQDANPLTELVEAGWVHLEAEATVAGRDLIDAVEEYARRYRRGGRWVPRARRLGAMLRDLGCEQDGSKGIRDRQGRPCKGWRGLRVDLDAVWGPGAEAAWRSAAERQGRDAV